MNSQPPGWTSAALRTLLAVLESGSRPRGGVAGVKHGTPSIGGEHLDTSGGIKLTNMRFVPPAFAAQMRRGRVSRGDILIVKDGATTGKVARIRGDFPLPDAVVNEHVFACRCYEGVNSDYVFYFLWSHEGQEAILRNFRGSAQGGIVKSFAEHVVIPVPPRQEQERIVAAIQENFVRLDDGAAALDRLRTRLDGLWRAVVDHAFENLVGAPSESGSEVFRYVTSGSRGWAKYYSNTGPAFLRVGNVQRSDIRLDLSDVQRVTPPSGAEGRRTLVQPGDVLITITADIGRVAVVPDGFEEAFINQHVAIARPREGVCPEYLAWFISGSNGQKQLRGLQRGVTKIGLGLNDIRALQIPLPDSNTQNSVTATLNRTRTVVDGQAATVAKQIARLNTLRSSILAAAFSGELTPQNPSDEPASALLERIASDRTSSDSHSTGRTRKPRRTTRNVPA